ncbi:uncharacterized protein FA14DRAFT_155690 [Meira miltonrushii]|uniref:Uncharacterized protein n=1 Tax=Meira miltonrushii TaxID=1280837 RepID=A0A316VJ09_9BASI|nr:uncharacterized protein FA14DRAFT_155690 [Meira miltonrushii]PWN36283.1 hypothetical protein FA14DRAFT_155690 [Meira miltonrushii]
MSLSQRRISHLHNLPQPQMINSQTRMKRLPLRKSPFHVRDQSTVSFGLLPANLPDAPLTARANDTTKNPVSIGLTVGCTLLLIMIVSLLTILFCVWHRKKSLRSKALDCRKSPWTQRYRDGTRNGIPRPELHMTRIMEEKNTQEGYFDQQKNTYTIYKDTPLLEEHDSYSKESDIDPSFQNEQRLAKQGKAQIESSYLNASTTKRRTKLPDVWCSPVLPMPNSARMSPRVRNSVFQNPYGHIDVIRGSLMKGLNSEDSSATMIGLGLMVEADTAYDYTIVDDPSPVEKTGELWDPVKGSLHADLICSADKYAALMPKGSLLRQPERKKTESLGVMSRSPSDTSIYTAVSLATLVVEENMIPATLSKDDDEKKGESEIFNIVQRDFRESKVPSSRQKAPKKSKTISSFRGERKSRTSSSRLLDEIFDEQTDARVTRTFTAAMRMMKKNLKARKPPTQSKKESVATMEDERPVSLRSLARRSEVRRRTKMQSDRTSALLSHAISPYVEKQHPNVVSDQQVNHSKQNSNDSIESACSSLRQGRISTMEYHLPSRLSASGAKVFTLSPQKMVSINHSDMALPTTPQNKQPYNRDVKPLVRKRTIRTIDQDKLICISDSKGRGSVLLTAKAVHRKSRSLDSCLSSAILGYLHTPTSVKVPSRSNTGPYVPPVMLETKRGRSNTDLTIGTACNTTPLRIRKTANSLLFAKVKHKRVSQLIQTHGGSLKKMQYNNRESQYSTDGEYASPTMQVVALYDEYSSDEEDDNMSITTSEQSHFPNQFHRRSRSQEFFLS